MALYVEDEGNALAISPKGGTVTQWLVDGRNVLFPEQLVQIGDKIKLRGGIPVMHPNFGTPPKGIDLQKHGFLRHKILGTAEKGRSNLLAYYDSRDDGTVADFSFPHSVIVSASILETTLKHGVEIRNLSKQLGSKMPIGTGIHPYFRLPKGTGDIELRNSFVQITGEYGPRIIADNPPGYITINAHGLGHIHMRILALFYDGKRQPEKQITLVIWTDGGKNEKGESYVCVEPVVADPKVFNTKEGFFIEPGKRLIMEYKFLFVPE